MTDDFHISLQREGDLTEEINWKLLLMKCMDAVIHEEGTCFEPWHNVTKEEQTVIDEAFMSYCLEDREKLSRKRRSGMMRF